MLKVQLVHYIYSSQRLYPQIVDAVTIPSLLLEVADGRGLAAAIALGYAVSKWEQFLLQKNAQFLQPIKSYFIRYKGRGYRSHVERQFIRNEMTDHYIELEQKRYKQRETKKLRRFSI